MPASSRASDTTEVELKLEVVGDRPAATLAAVERLDRLAGQRLGPPARHLIHDRYWDTPDGALRGCRVKLRLREIDGLPLFTLKRGRRKSGGLFTCRELELPATRDNWRMVVEALACLGLELPPADSRSPGAADWPAAAGLRVVQDRTTRRVVRPIGGEDGPTAELALDTTRYHFDDRTADSYEIEIEQLGGATTAVRALGEALLALFPGQLEPAKKGKFGRGLELGKN